VGRTPRSAADAPVGFLGLDNVDFVGEKRVRSTIVAIFPSLGKTKWHFPIVGAGLLESEEGADQGREIAGDLVQPERACISNTRPIAIRPA
jgi:hypothetical protein